jgi:hypothetical protein
VSENQLGFFSSTFLYLVPQSTHTTDNTPPSAPTNLHTTFQSAPPEAWLEWSPSTDDSDGQDLILYEVYLDGVLVPDGVIGGTNTIAYCRDIGQTEILLRGVDTFGSRSGPSNSIQFDC